MGGNRWWGVGAGVGGGEVPWTVGGASSPFGGTQVGNDLPIHQERSEFKKGSFW